MSAPRLGLALQGNLREHMTEERRRLVRADRVAPVKTAERLKERARREVRRAFGLSAGRRGRKVENAIRSRAYHDGEFRTAAIVYSKFGRREGGQFQDYLLPYEQGGEIKAKGKYMVIPAKGVSRRTKRALRELKRLNQDPKLALIPQPGGRFLFVRHSSARRTVIIAWLIRRFRRKKILDLKGVTDRVEREYPEIYIAELERAT